MFHSQSFVEKLTKLLPEESYAVELAMRYQNPSIAKAIDVLIHKGVEQITLMPMFPQYSSAAYGSAVERVMAVLAEKWNVIPVSVVPPFFADDGFIEPMAAITREALAGRRVDKYLFSFHGVPERQCQKSELTLAAQECCVVASCCDAIKLSNRFCYRAQCFASARALAASLGLTGDQWEVCFQSRLGRTPWIRPYTDERILALAEEGKENLAVLCPSFVTDCLETTEEIGMRAREDFIAAGGKELWLVPGLNDADVWVAGAAKILARYLPKQPAQDH